MSKSPSAQYDPSQIDNNHGISYLDSSITPTSWYDPQQIDYNHGITYNDTSGTAGYQPYNMSSGNWSWSGTAPPGYFDTALNNTLASQNGLTGGPTNLSAYGNAPTNVTHAGDNPYAPTTQGQWSGNANSGYTANWGATYNPAGMTQPGAGTYFTNQYAPWPIDYNAGTPAAYAPYLLANGSPAMFNGNPLTFNVSSTGNPTNKPVNIPAIADLLKAYPMLTPDLAATMVKPLQAVPGSGPVPYAQNPYNQSAPGVGGLSPSGHTYQLSQADYQQIMNLPRNATPAQLAKLLPASIAPQGDVAATTAAYNALDAAYRRNPNDPFIKQQLLLAGKAMDTALYGPLASAVKMASTSPANAVQMLQGMVNVANTAPKPTTYTERLRDWYGYSGPGAGMRVQATLKSAGWTPDMGHAPRNWTYPNGKPVPAKTQAMLNDMLVNSGPKNQAPTVNQLMPGLKNIGNMGLSNNRTIINMLAQQQSGRSGGNEPSNRAPTPAPAPAPTSMPPEVANWFRYNLPAWGTGNAQNTTLQALLGLA